MASEVQVRFASSTRADGDLSLARLQAGEGEVAIGAPVPWTWLRQEHGTSVVVVTRPGEHAGAAADGAITDRPGCTLAVRTADCAPLVLAGRRSVAVLHLGWRGVLGGLVARGVDAMRALGDEPLGAHLGPCIRPSCYEFAGPELDGLVDRFGPGVAASTSAGAPALDLPGAVAVALAEQGVTDLDDAGHCTACEPHWFSHRARQDAGRFATLAWLEAPA